MATSSYRDLFIVCEARGLKQYSAKNGVLFKGYINGSYRIISIHAHAKGRDIPEGTFRGYVKQLGFNNKSEYFDFLERL